MSTFKIQIQWRMTGTLDAIHRAIAEGGQDDWPGLTSADQIISICWREDLHGYCVVWKVREWEAGDDR